MSRMTAPAETDILAASRPATGARLLRFVPSSAPTQHSWSAPAEPSLGRCTWLPGMKAQPIDHTQCATHASCESTSDQDVGVL